MKVEFSKTIKKETEKAICVALLGIWGGGIEKEIDVWMPKSQIEISENVVVAPTWLLEAKESDLSKPHASFHFIRSQFSVID